MLDIFDNTCMLLAKAEQKHFQYTKEILNKSGLGITPVQLLVLYTLFKGDGISQTDLSNRCCLDNSTLTGVIDRLQAADFVRRDDDPVDRRTYRIVLTDKAHSIREKMTEVSNIVLNDMSVGCTSEEIATCRKVLLAIFENLS